MGIIIDATWKAGIVLGLGIALGALVDNYLLQGQRVRLHDRLSLWFDQVSRWSPRELPSKTAALMLAGIRRLGGPRVIGRRAIVVSLLGSWLLTSLAYVIGQGVQGNALLLPFPHIYAVNYLFDVATVLVTLKLLVIIQRGRALVGVFGAVADAVVAVTLAVTALFTFDVVGRFILAFSVLTFLSSDPAGIRALEERLRSDGWFEREGLSEEAEVIDISGSSHPVWQFVKEAPAIYRAALKGETHEIAYSGTVGVADKGQVRYYRSPGGAMHLPGIYASMTTLLPTLAFLIVMLVITMSRPVLGVGRAGLMQFLGVNREANPLDSKSFKPFTLLGATIGTVGAVLSAFAQIARGPT